MQLTNYHLQSHLIKIQNENKERHSHSAINSLVSICNLSIVILKKNTQSSELGQIQEPVSLVH